MGVIVGVELEKVFITLISVLVTLNYLDIGFHGPAGQTLPKRGVEVDLLQNVLSTVVNRSCVGGFFYVVLLDELPHLPQVDVVVELFDADCGYPLTIEDAFVDVPLADL